MQAVHDDISDVGRVLIDVIDGQPGIHFRGLERAANLNSAGQLRHHIDRLLRHRLIVEYEEGGYKRFFLSGNHDPQLLPRIARFARPVPRRIAKLLIARPLSRTELRRRLGCADSTLGYHLTRMTLLGDVVKHRRCNNCHYSLADPEAVRAALQALEGTTPEGAQRVARGYGNGAAAAHGPDRDPGRARRPEPVMSGPADPVPHAVHGASRRRPAFTPARLPQDHAVNGVAPSAAATGRDDDHARQGSEYDAGPTRPASANVDGPGHQPPRHEHDLDGARHQPSGHDDDADGPDGQRSGHDDDGPHRRRPRRGVHLPSARYHTTYHGSATRPVSSA